MLAGGLGAALAAGCGGGGAAGTVAVPGGPLPEGWTTAVLSPSGNAPGGAGARAGFEGGRFGLRASGLGIHPSGAADEHLFVFRKVRGDKGITARVAAADACGARASFGVIVRPTLDGDSGYALSAAAGARGIAQQGRVFQGGVAIPLRLDTDTPLPVWVRVERRGFSLLSAWSTDGQTWATKTIASPFPPDIYLGLVASSHDPKRACAAVFDSVAIDEARLPLPAVVVTEIPGAGAAPAAGDPPDGGAGRGAGPGGGGPGRGGGADAGAAPDAGGNGGEADGGAGSDPADAAPRPPGMSNVPLMRCNQLLPVGVDPVSRTIADDSPFPAGGDIKEGIYFRVGTETYTGPGGPASAPADGGAGGGGGAAGPGRFVSRTTIAVTRADDRTYTVETVNFSQTAFGTNASYQTSKWTRRGSSLGIQGVCPNMTDETISGYAMNDNDLLLFSVFRQPSGAPAVNVTRYTFQPAIKHNGVGQPPTLPAPPEPDAGAP